MLRDVQKKNAALGHFFVPQQFWNLLVDMWGGDQIQKFVALFSQIVGEIWRKKCPKSFGKKLANGKVPQKVQNPGRGGLTWFGKFPN